MKLLRSSKHILLHQINRQEKEEAWEEVRGRVGHGIFLILPPGYLLTKQKSADAEKR